MNIDGSIEKYVNVVLTQDGIRAFILKAASVLAEAGRASAKATGDRAETSARKWGKILVDEACRQLANNPNGIPTFPDNARKNILSSSTATVENNVVSSITIVNTGPSANFDGVLND